MSESHSPTAAGNQEVRTAESAPGGWRTGPLTGFILAVVGGAIAWGIIESTSPVFMVPEKYHIVSLGPPPEKVAALKAVQAKVDRLNTMLEVTWLGALVAGMIALGESIARRSLTPVLIAVPVSAVAGLVAGFVGNLAWAALTMGPLTTLRETAVVQALMLGVLGIGVGLALSLSSKSLKRVAASGIAGMAVGVLAGILYPIGISLLAALATTDSVVPKGAVNRLFWIGICAALWGVTVVATVRRPEHRLRSERAS